MTDDMTAWRPAPSNCPGLYRIVPAKDGGICRIRMPLGLVSSGQARAIAEAARLFGSGEIEITNRANFQLRGVRSEAEQALIGFLRATSVAPDQPSTDDIRNVMISPTAGIDPTELLDVRPLAEAVLDRLMTVEAFRGLSPKFCLLIDGGGEVAVMDHPHDIWLAAVRRQDGEVMLRLGLAGIPDMNRNDDTQRLIAPVDCVAVTAALIGLFLDLAAERGSDVSRFRHLTGELGAEGLLDRLETRLGHKLLRPVETVLAPRSAILPLGHVGIHDQRQAGRAFIGGVPFVGRLDHLRLTQLADLADRFSEGRLRLTPWQSIMLTNVPRVDANAAVACLEAIGLTCDAAHPAATLMACSGSAGCVKAAADTRLHAAQLAMALAGQERGQTVHLSGCNRSCAMPGTADVTLLAVAPDAYDVYRRIEPAANDPVSGKFGQLCAAAVPIRQVPDLLASFAAGQACPSHQEK